MINEKELYKNVIPFLNCKDHTVSKETFEVMIHLKYDILVTSPVPVNLNEYYKSEDYISHSDSKNSLFDKVYQIVKNHTVKQKLNLLNSFQVTEKKVLDVGAGTGGFLKKCKESNWTIFGVEPNIIARKHAATKKIFLVDKLSSLKERQFDVITLWHVLEHVENLIEYIENLKSLLKPNGYLVVAVPNYKSFDALYYKEYWAAFDVPRHVWHFSQKGIKKIFKSVQMNIKQILPMRFDAYYVSLLSEKYKKGFMNPIKAFWIGFQSNLSAKKTSEYSSLIYIIKKN